MTLIHADPKLIASIGATYVATASEGQQNVATPPSFGKSIERVSKPIYDNQSKKQVANSLSISWSEILPEVASERIVKSLFENSNELKIFVQACRENKILPGSLAYINGFLKIGELEKSDPSKVGIPSIVFHGEDCFVGEIHDDPYFIPVYFIENAHSVFHSNKQMIKVLGVCKWVPWFKPGSGSPIGVALRVAAVWMD